LKVADRNKPGSLRIAVPTFVAQGGADDTVMPRWTDAMGGALCRNGIRLLFRVYPEADHETVVDRGSVEVQHWIDGRFATEDAGSSCDALPTAANVQ